MSSSTRSGGVVGERTWWAAEAVVERDRGGQGEEADADACAEAVEGEQVFAGLEDRFDALPDRREVELLGRLVLAARPDDRGVEQLGGGLELAAGVAFVADHEQVPGALTAFEQAEADLAFGCLGRS